MSHKRLGIRCASGPDAFCDVGSWNDERQITFEPHLRTRECRVPRGTVGHTKFSDLLLSYADLSWVSSIGSFRRRFPVAANTALTMAGAMQAVAGSPMPPGASVLSTT
jgi:hypothetical protein